MPSGRPQVYTDEQIIEALKKSRGLVYTAAERVGCDADTIYTRAKQSPAIRAAIKHQRGKIIDRAEEKLFAAINAREPWAVALILKTLGKDRGYVERTETRVVSDDDVNRAIEAELAGVAGQGSDADAPEIAGTQPSESNSE